MSNPQKTTYPFVETLAEAVGVTAARMEAALLAAEKRGDLRLFGQPQDLASIDAATRLQLLLTGKLSPTIAAEILAPVLTGIGHRVELRDVTWQSAPVRPRIDGLPETITDFLAALADHGDDLRLCRIDADRLRVLSDLIRVRRALIAAAEEFTGWATADIAFYEREAADAMKAGYDRVRPGVLAARGRLGLQQVEDYFYGPAQQAAETRATAAATADLLVSEVSHQSREEGRIEGRKEALDAIANAPTTRGGTSGRDP